MDEHGWNGTQLQIAGVEIGVGLEDRFFLRVLPQFVPTNPSAMLLERANRFDTGQYDLRCMPELQTPADRQILRQGGSAVPPLAIRVGFT
jgi:hypothetical protein